MVYENGMGNQLARVLKAAADNHVTTEFIEFNVGIHGPLQGDGGMQIKGGGWAFVSI